MNETDITTQMEFDIWFENGVNRGWISPAVCVSHGDIPINTEEANQMEAEVDPCILVARIWALAV